MPRGGPRRTGGRSPTSRRRVEPHPLAARVGARIKELRREAAMSFVELIAISETGRGYLSELERGLVVPNIEVLDRIAKALGVSLADVVTFPDEDDRQRLIDATRLLSQGQLRGLRKEVEKLAEHQKRGRSQHEPRE